MITRRRFLTLASRAALGCALGGLGYGVLETRWLRVRRLRVRLPGLPNAFAGTTVAFLSDIHHSQVVPRHYLERVVEETNALEPDLIILGGDYVTSGKKYDLFEGERYIEPCFEALARLRAKMGIFAVTGNHDKWAGLRPIRLAMQKAGIVDLTNHGRWISQGTARIRLGGVGDIWTQRQDPGAAIGDATAEEVVVLVSHNPDYAEEMRDRRVRLVLSGHTHGGQVALPLFGAPRVPSQYGQKYRYGLVQAPVAQVYITSGVGVLPLAVRIGCRPEIALLTLTA